MGNIRFVNFNTQSPTVNAFLGGITFTALVIFTQSQNTFKLHDLLIPLTAFTSILFIMATLSSMKEPSKEGSVHPYLFKFNVLLTTIGISILLVGIIPLIVYNFSNQIMYFVMLSSSILLMGMLSIFTVMSKNRPISS